MKPLPQESLERSPKKSQRIKGQNPTFPGKKYQSRGVKLSPEQIEAKKLARQMENFAEEKNPRTASEITTLIGKLRLIVLQLNFKRSMLKGATKKAKSRHNNGKHNRPRSEAE